MCVCVFFHEYCRENAAGLYGAYSYWVSSWILQVPIIATSTAIYASILYNLAGLYAEGNRFQYFYVTILILSWIGQLMFQCLAALGSSAQICLSLMAIPQFFMIAFSGYIVFIPDFETWLRVWAPEASGVDMLTCLNCYL